MRVPLMLVVLTVMIVVWALVEVVQADKAEVRRLPKWAWLILVVFPLPPTGAIAWFFLGRPKADAPGVGTAGGTGLNLPNLPRRTRYVARPAPDDDPEFLRRLNEEAERHRLLRRMEDDLKSNPSEPNDKPGESAPRD